jgi:hypothetical protein
VAALRAGSLVLLTVAIPKWMGSVVSRRETNVSLLNRRVLLRNRRTGLARCGVWGLPLLSMPDVGLVYLTAGQVELETTSDRREQG